MVDVRADSDLVDAVVVRVDSAPPGGGTIRWIRWPPAEQVDLAGEMADSVAVVAHRVAVVAQWVAVVAQWVAVVGAMGGRGGAMGGRGGAPGGRGGPMGGGGLAGGSLDVEIEQSRLGSDFTDYWKAIDAKTPTADYRLVRFFDVLAKPGVTYEYRMRVWVGDPNNEDLNQTFAVLQGGGGISSSRSNDLDDEDYEDELDDEGEADEAMTRGNMLTLGQTGQQTDAEPMYQHIEITSKMKAPSVRQRIQRIKEADDPQTGMKTYFVSEIRGTDDQGQDVIEEAMVPRRKIQRSTRCRSILLEIRTAFGLERHGQD